MIKRDTLQKSSLRAVKSFVAREGRKSAAQLSVFTDLWPIFGLSLSSSIMNIDQVFGRTAPTTLEIGFGDGRSLLALAQAHPEHNFIGIEVYRSGIAKLLQGIKEYNLKNIRIFCADAMEVLANCIPDSSLSQLQLFFPDPWPKARHHKRRIVQQDFIDLVARKLQPGAKLHMATDWQDYAQHMLNIMEEQSGWSNAAGKNKFSPRPLSRPITKFEQRGTRLGHGTWDLIFHKNHNI